MFKSLISRFITPYIPWIVLGGVVLFGLYSAWLYNKGDTNGYKRKSDEIVAAANKVKAEARKELVEMEKGHEKVSKAISQVEASDCIGNRTDASANWLRQNYIDR